MWERLVRWLEARGWVANEADSLYYDWADQVLDLQDEYKERASRHWRDGGPGSGEYELWLRGWQERMGRLNADFRQRRRAAGLPDPFEGDDTPGPPELYTEPRNTGAREP